MPVQGFGVDLDGDILIRTVTDTERAAQVNGLAICFGVVPEQFWSDEYIERLWYYFVGQIEIGHYAKIVPVVVEPARQH